MGGELVGSGETTATTTAPPPTPTPAKPDEAPSIVKPDLAVTTIIPDLAVSTARPEEAPTTTIPPATLKRFYCELLTNGSFYEINLKTACLYATDFFNNKVVPNTLALLVNSKLTGLN